MSGLDGRLAGDAVRVVTATRADSGVLISCEHASNRLPGEWAWAAEDERLVDTHWAFDLGATELTLELAREVGAGAVLSSFTRLLADPNRPEDSPELFRRHADGLPVHLNHEVGEGDRALRLDGYYRPFHEAMDRVVSASGARVLLSMHTFTPVYEGTPRSVEVGVLFDREEALAAAVLAHLEEAGLRARANEPYSGRSGLMHSVDRHATKHGLRALELEVRQDLAVQPAFRARLVPLLARIFEALPVSR